MVFEVLIFPDFLAVAFAVGGTGSLIGVLSGADVVVMGAAMVVVTGTGTPGGPSLEVVDVEAVRE